jgi:hypothetical protein
MIHRLALLAAALACCTGVHAAPPAADPVMSKDEIKANLVRIEEQYDHAQTRCRRVQGHARELCNEHARGERDIEVAELELRAHPTADNDQKLRVARAEAAYSTSLVKCKDMDGQARVVCRDDARRTFNDAKAEAKLQREVADQTLRADNSVRERTAEAERVAQAQFNAARERCEMLPGEGRAACIADAKKRFGRL